MLNIEGHKQVIAEICKELRVKRLDLVGSASRDDFQAEKSDIDVLVEFEGREKLFDRYFELKTRLEEHFGREVDVIQESAVKNPYVRESLSSHKVPIYAA